MLIQITVDLREKKLCNGDLDFSWPWQQPQDAAQECKAQDKDAESGYGVAYAVYVNGTLALPGNKDHKKIVKSIKQDVARRVGFLSK